MNTKGSNDFYPLSETEKQRIGKYLAEEQRLRIMLQANIQMINDLVNQIMETKDISGETHILDLETMVIVPRAKMSTASP